MGLLEDIALLGADTDDGSTRFMGNTALYERMLKKLPEVIKDNPVQPFVRSGDLETALSNAHTLKGVTGNLSLTPLYNSYVDVVGLLRSGNSEKAEKKLESALEIQQRFVECIKKYD